MITVTMTDFQRLSSRILEARRKRIVPVSNLERLGAELKKAKKVASSKVSPKVVTMNSTVKLIDQKSGSEWVIKLVYHEEADMSNNKLSIFAPIGIGLIGYTKGDTFECEVPGGKKSMQIADILYQPESNKEYHL